MRGFFIIPVLVLAANYGCGRTPVLVSSDASNDTEAWDTGDEPEGEALCLLDADCQNGLVCDGEEKCMDGVCMAGEPLACDDGNDCTIVSCSEEEGGCVFTPRDLDGDGFGDAACGGTDCDDTRNDVYPGAPGSCNEGEDLNCTGTPDLDDDQDGYVDAACPGGDDCDDDDPDTYPGAPEVCLDGKDQDCDGIVDGPMLMSSNVKISDLGSRYMSLDMVWTGSVFGIAWDGIYFTRVSAEGVEIGEERVVSESSCSYPPCNIHPSMAWTGSEFVIASKCQLADYGGALCYTRLNPSGRNITGDVILSPFSNDIEKAVALAWTGSVAGFAWNEYTQEWYNCIHFKEIHPTGEDATAEIVLNEYRGKHPQLAWTGSEFGVVWYCGGICFGRVSAEGDMLGEKIQVTYLNHWFMHVPAPIWTGSEFGIVWYDERVEDSFDQIYYARLNSHGEKVGEDIMLSDPMVTSRNPQIVWTGSEIGAAWITNETRVLIFHSADPMGEAIGSDLELAEATPGGRFPLDIVWTGSEFGVVWVWTPGDERNGTYFNRIGFCD